MSRTEATGSTLDARAEALVAGYARAGYARVSPAILQPAEAFLDLSGEDIRARMYLTTDAAGNDFCLRPDFTIPVAQGYLASPKAGSAQGFCYLGPVFRDRGGGPGEILQAGIELFGRSDIAAADAETLSLGLEATAHFGFAAPEIRMGDVGLFAALVDALDLAPAWKRRLKKDFNRKSNLTQDLDRLTLGATNGGSDYQGVLAALAGSDPKAAHALVTDLAVDRGHHHGRRPHRRRNRRPVPGAIRARRVGGFAEGDARADREFPRIAGNPDDAIAQLRKLADDARIALAPALDLARNARRLSRRARRRREAHQIRLRVRARHGLLHRVRVRAARSERVRTAGRGRTLRRHAAAARRQGADSGGRLLGLDRAASAQTCAGGAR